MFRPVSEVGRDPVGTAVVLGANLVRLPEVTLAFGRLLGEDVASFGVACLVLAGSGLPEALGRAPIRLDLGHCVVLEGFLLLARAVAMVRWGPPRFPSSPRRLESPQTSKDPDGATRLPSHPRTQAAHHLRSAQPLQHISVRGEAYTL